MSKAKALLNEMGEDQPAPAAPTPSAPPAAEAGKGMDYTVADMLKELQMMHDHLQGVLDDHGPEDDKRDHDHIKTAAGKLHDAIAALKQIKH